MEAHPAIQESFRHRPSFLKSFWDRDGRFDTLRLSLDSLLHRGLDGATLQIEDRESRQAIEVRKYIHAEKRYGIELLLDRNVREMPGFSRYEKLCKEEGVPFRLDNLEDHNHSGKIRVDFGKSVDDAEQLVASFLADVLNLHAGSRFVTNIEGLSPWLETIDSPNQKVAAPLEGIRSTDEWLRRREGAGFLSGVYVAFASLCQLLGMVGLLVTLLFQTTDWSGFTLSLLSKQLSVPWFGAVSIILVLIGFSAVFSNIYWLMPNTGGTEVHATVPKSLRGLAFVYFGRPINWIAIGLLALVILSWM